MQTINVFLDAILVISITKDEGAYSTRTGVPQLFKVDNTLGFLEHWNETF